MSSIVLPLVSGLVIPDVVSKLCTVSSALMLSPGLQRVPPLTILLMLVPLCQRMFLLALVSGMSSGP